MSTSLNQFKQTKCKILPDDLDAIYDIDGKQFVFIKSNKILIYRINGDKCNVFLKVFDGSTEKWTEYKLKNSENINVKAEYVWNVSIAPVLNENGKHVFFIKYIAPRKYLQQQRALARPYSFTLESKFKIQVLTTLSVNINNNYELNDGYNVNQTINHPILFMANNENYFQDYVTHDPNTATQYEQIDIFNYQVGGRISRNHIHSKNTKIFSFRNEVYCLLPVYQNSLSIVVSDGKGNEVHKNIYLAILCKYDKQQNEFKVKFNIKLERYLPNLDIIVDKSYLFIFETFTTGGAITYYANIHCYDAKSDTFTKRKNICNLEPMFTFECGQIINGKFIILISKLHEYIYLYDITHNTLIKTKLQLPSVDACYKMIKMENQSQNEKLISGDIRELTLQHVDIRDSMPPQYLLQLIGSYFTNEQILIWCNDKIYTEREEPVYSFDCWQFDANELF